MVKRKNYDSPFDKEEHNSFELENIFDSESLQNTEFTDEFYDYLPSQIDRKSTRLNSSHRCISYASMEFFIFGI